VDCSDNVRSGSPDAKCERRHRDGREERISKEDAGGPGAADGDGQRPNAWLARAPDLASAKAGGADDREAGGRREREHVAFEGLPVCPSHCGHLVIRRARRRHDEIGIEHDADAGPAMAMHLDNEARC
jgi:hypothetical protein